MGGLMAGAAVAERVPDQRPRRATVDAVFAARRDVPPEWQAELEQIVRKSVAIPWLQLAWYPGMPYEPVQRWVIYEMVPELKWIPAHWLEDIRGPSPRERGVWVKDPFVDHVFGGKRWVSTSQHSLVQWELFRATNCYPMLFWVLQGDRGGHVYRLHHVERNFRLSLGQMDVPDPGDLPYAPWDNRVRDQIARYDRLRHWHQEMTAPWTDRSMVKSEAGVWVQRETYDLEKRYAEEMLRFLDSQIEDAVRDIPRRLLPGLSDLPRGDPHFNREEDALERRLIEDLSHAPNGEGD